LHRLFGRPVGRQTIGESWELVELPQHHSVLAGEASTEGKLGDLWRAGRLGGSAQGRFPFLLKWLDTQDWLSVQVHPDDETATALAGAEPKTEAWYVAEAEPEAAILIGHYPGLDGATLRQAAAGGTLQKWMYETRPRPGDMLLVEGGTLHTIGPGLLLLEVQQPSDSTYRVFDWQRPGLDSALRPLHLEEAAQAIRFERAGPVRARKGEVAGPCFAMRELKTADEVPDLGLRVLAATTAGATLAYRSGGAEAEARLAPGEVVVLEPADCDVILLSGVCIFITEPPSADEE